MIMIILLVVMIFLCVILSYLLSRSANRLLEFDDLFELLAHDLDVNITYLDKLNETPLFSNEPMVVDVHHNMQLMRQRFEEFILRMEETTNRQLVAKKPVPPPPPARMSMGEHPPKVV